ncbi:MAG TPA: ester cyclase [Solirubrobacterales bacterium]|nr:ester cyclase [Solirubrobacterales bacterium]
MSEKSDEVAATARAYFEAVGARDVEAMMRQWELPGVGRIHGVAELRAPEGYREWFGALFAAFPDFRFEIVSVTADEERAAVRWRATGSFDGTGRFEGMAPNGRRVDVEGCDVLEVREGKIVDLNAYLNGAEMTRQLGALPAAGSPSEKLMLGAVNLKARLAAALGRG